MVVLAGATGTVGVVGTHRVGMNLKHLATDSMPGVLTLTRVEAAALEISASSHALTLPGLEDYKARQLVRIAELEKEIPRILRDYSPSVSAEERPLYNKVNAASAAFLTTCAKYGELLKEGKLQEASEFWRQSGSVQWGILQRSLDAEIEFNRNNAVADMNSGAATSNVASKLTGGLLALAVGLGCLLGILITGSINRALRRSADQLRSSAQRIVAASTQVASVSEELAQGASEQAASLEETSASSHEVSATTQRNAENSHTAAALMSDVDRKVGDANGRLELLVASMREISGSSERIAKIIKVIDEIAFQTNILALNAAVEAARAGEAGMGFAVVADEVRNLAQRCADAAKNTTTLIEESVTNAQSGTIRLSEVSEAIRGITEYTAKAKILVDEVSASGVEQARGIDQISAALTQMEAVTQRTAGNAEEGASASQELKAQAVSLENVVVTLEELVSKNAERPRPLSVKRPVPRKPPAKATSKQGLLSLQKAVGMSQKPKGQEPRQPVPLGKEKFVFPLDDAEFREF